MPRRPALSSYAGPMPRSVVPILRRPRCSSESASRPRWCGRMRCARSETTRLSPISTPSASSSPVSRSNATGSTTTPLPITQRIPGCRIPEGMRCRTNFLPADDHGVAGVVAAVVAGHDLDPRGEQVDDLPLAFVAPLGAGDHDVGHVPRAVGSERRLGLLERRLGQRPAAPTATARPRTCSCTAPRARAGRRRGAGRAGTARSACS